MEYIEYLQKRKTLEQVFNWLDDYENQGCHLYLMGAHRRKELEEGESEWSGATYTHGSKDLGVVFVYAGGSKRPGPSILITELHENACWDHDVGRIGYCESTEPCACKETGTAAEFCSVVEDNCVDKLKAAQDLDN